MCETPNHNIVGAAAAAAVVVVVVVVVVVAVVVVEFCNIPYVGKFWSGKKLANLANCGLFANILPANNFFSEIQNYFSN